MQPDDAPKAYLYKAVHVNVNNVHFLTLYLLHVSGKPSIYSTRVSLWARTVGECFNIKITFQFVHNFHEFYYNVFLEEFIIYCLLDMRDSVSV